MKKAVFVAPYFLDATERFIEAASRVPDVQLGLVSCDPVSRLPDAVRQRLTANHVVPDVSTPQLLGGVEAIAGELGGLDRILGMLEQIQVPLGEIRDHLGIPGMGAEVANHFRDKAVMKSVLRQAGIPCAKHAKVVDIDAAEDAAESIGFPLIVKPADGAGAKGTFRCENMPHFRECLIRLHPRQDAPVVIEEFIVGREHSFDSVCLEGKLVWSSISHYSPGPLEVVREPWIQWCVMIPREPDAPQYRPIQDIAQAALAALGMDTGLSHMEWFLRPDGSIAISEVGARPPGAQFTSLISYAHDFNLYRAWADMLIHDRFEIPERKYAVGAAYLRGMGRGRVSAVHGLEAVARKLGPLAVEAKIPEPGDRPAGGYEGEGYIIVRDPRTRVVEEALQTIITSVRVEMRD